jgi:hypothetical protein
VNAREYFDLLCRTSRAGGFPATEPNYPGSIKCRYRTSDGKKCAIGLIIPDDKYIPEAEGASSLWCQRMGLFDVPEGLTTNDMIRIQFAHDDITKATGTEFSPPWPHDRFVKLLRKQVPKFAAYDDPTTTEPQPCSL